MTTRYFTHIAETIAAAKTKADSLAACIDHPGLAGEIREIAITDCIRPFLTQSYQCATGKVIDTLENQSDQIDLVVFHRKVVPPILIGRDLGLFPVECVRYVFEIKSTLTASDIRDANKKFQSVSKLRSFPRRQPDGTIVGGGLPSTVIFAFGSDIRGSEIDRYMKYTDSSNPPCTVLCVLGKGYWFYDHPTKKWYDRQKSAGDPPYTEFCRFITGFMNTLAGEETSLRPFKPGAYVITDDSPIPEVPVSIPK